MTILTAPTTKAEPTVASSDSRRNRYRQARKSPITHTGSGRPVKPAIALPKPM
jgi:hypothetical protein